MKRTPPQKPTPPAGLARTRIRRGLTQTQLAEMVGVHRNSIQNLERGATREVAPARAAALAKALNATIEELDLRVRTPIPASIRMRQLTPQQRAVVADLLDLPDEDFEFIGMNIRALKERNARRATPRTPGR